MSTDEIIEHIERMSALSERILKWIIALIVMTASGVAWGLRLEAQSVRASERLDEHQGVLRSHDQRLHDIDVTLARKF